MKLTERKCGNCFWGKRYEEDSEHIDCQCSEVMGKLREIDGWCDRHQTQEEVEKRRADIDAFEAERIESARAVKDAHDTWSKKLSADIERDKRFDDLHRQSVEQLKEHTVYLKRIAEVLEQTVRTRNTNG